ncbi:MAG: glycoside hydrolase family 3 protein, partial [Bacteroidales bacterium]|nr:glycoside hydrolase family 3 protein [Bacteroidales bacterium]
MKQTLPIILFVLFVSNVEAQHYKDPKLPVDERVHDLLQRMSPEEKFMQLFMIPYEPGVDTAMYEPGVFGFQMGAEAQDGGAEAQLMSYNRSEHANKNIEKINNLQRWFIERNRLGIPVIIFGEALHGLVADGATVFPQSIALAATWNTPLMSSVADAIAVECAAAGIRQILSPVVNVATDVRWGRTEETYGEDPFLVSEMGVAYVSAFERRGIITTPKHFAANVGDGGRDSYPVHYNKRYMREVIFPPFEACIKKGGSRSIMTAYNSYDGTPCSANSFLLYQILRKEWGFKGFVISDAGATGVANVLHYTAADYGDAAV